MTRIQVEACGGCPFKGRAGHGEPAFCHHPEASKLYLVIPTNERHDECPLDDNPVKIEVK